MIQDYPLTALATAASAIATWVIGGIAGTSRYKYGVKAPATTGHIEYEKRNRAHMNAVENIVCFLPTLWVYALASGNDVVAGSFGLLWVVGRILFTAGYIKDPQNRGTGYAIQGIGMLGAFGGSLYYCAKMIMNKYF